MIKEVKSGLLFKPASYSPPVITRALRELMRFLSDQGLFLFVGEWEYHSPQESDSRANQGDPWPIRKMKFGELRFDKDDYLDFAAVSFFKQDLQEDRLSEFKAFYAERNQFVGEEEPFFSHPEAVIEAYLSNTEHIYVYSRDSGLLESAKEILAKHVYVSPEENWE